MKEYGRKVRICIVLSKETYRLLELTQKEMQHTGKNFNRSQIIEHAVKKLYSDPLQEKKERQKELAQEITTLSEEINKLETQTNQTKEVSAWDSKKSSTF